MTRRMWFYLDGSRILELSTRCPPSQAFQIAAESRGGSDRAGTGKQQTKTALQYFSKQLAGNSA